MKERAPGTLARADKGPLAPAPPLDGSLGIVADVVAGWPDVTASTHWELYRPTEVDGIDFYVGDEELGHIHLDGSIHLATSPTLGRSLIAAGLARPFRYQPGWVCEQVQGIGPEAAVALFRRNYESLTRTG